MTIRTTFVQADAIRKLSDAYQTCRQLGHSEATLDALCRAGYAISKREMGQPPLYKRGTKTL